MFVFQVGRVLAECYSVFKHELCLYPLASSHCRSEKGCVTVSTKAKWLFKYALNLISAIEVNHQ
jgi:hypothetical protein